MTDFRTMFGETRSGRFLRYLTRSRQARQLAVLSVLILVLVAIIALLERGANPPFRSVIDIFYWAAVTITTVGYGDITVRHALSKLLAVVLIVSGVIMVSIMTATFASIFTATRIKEGRGLKKIELQKHVIICGYNGNIGSVIRSVVDAAHRPIPDIVLVNQHPESDFTDLAERFPGVGIQFVYGDYTLEPALLRADIRNAAAVIVLADSGPNQNQKPDERTLLASLTIKSISKDIEVCAEVLDTASVPHLNRAGVDQTVVAGEFSGFFLANAVISPGIPQAFREIITVRNGADIRRESMPRDLVGKTFREAAADFMDRDGSLLLGVITERKTFNLESVLSGESGDIDAFIRRKFEEAGRSLEIEARGRLNVTINPGRDYIISADDLAVVLTPKQAEV